MYRRLRMQRWEALHKHDYESYNPYDPYSWAETDRLIRLLVEVVAVICFATGSMVFSWLGFDRLYGASRHEIRVSGFEP